MTKLRLVPVLALVLPLLAALTQVPAAHALSCVQQSAEQFVERADVVLIGTLLSYQNIYSNSVPSEIPSAAEVRVEQYLKGSGPANVSIESGAIAWAGGWQDEHIGQKRLFFLKGEGADYIESQESFVAEVFALAGAGIAPREAPENEESDARAEETDNGGGAAFPLAWGAGVAAVLAGMSGLGVAYLRWR
jgi:hypothetical protein